MGTRLLDFWTSLVEHRPTRCVICSPTGARTSCHTINEAALERANQWKSLGLKKRQVVALHATNGTEWMAAFIANLYCGSIVVPIDFTIPFENAKRIALKAGATLFCKQSESTFLENPNSRRFRDATIRLGKLTSGSTGDPKLLFFSDAELIADGQRIIKDMGIRPDDINMGVIPWGHSYGLGNIVVPLLIQGTIATWSPSPLPNEVIDSIEASKATVFPAVPALLKALVRSNCQSEQAASLRLVISAGSRLRPEIAHAFHEKFSLVPRNFYGSSETGSICYDPEGNDSLNGHSIGKPMTGVALEKARDNRLRVSSASVYTYRNRHRTADGKGSCLMVDRGQVDANGQVVLGSRAKGFAKIAGKRVALNEIEDQIKSVSGIRDALVIEIDSREDSTLGACIETELEKRDAITKIRQQLPRRLRPSVIKTYTEFPTTERGKTDFASLKADLMM